MSKIADKVFDVLSQMFPNRLGNRVAKEVYINFRGQRLFFDFYIKELGIYIEVQGRQHKEFVKHFHGTRENFLKQKNRDNLKISYVQENDKCLVRFYDGDEITEDIIRKKLSKVLEGECFYE